MLGSDSDVQTLNLRALDQRTLAIDIDVDAKAAAIVVARLVLAEGASHPMFDLSLAEPGPMDLVDLCFAGRADTRYLTQIASGGGVVLMARYCGPPAAGGPLPPPITVERRLVQQPTSGSSRPVERVVKLAVRFVTSRFAPPKLRSEASGRDQLTRQDLASAEDGILVVGSVVIEQSRSAGGYIGKPQALNIAIELSIDGKAIEAADTATQLRWSEQPETAVWRSGARGAVALPIRDAAGQIAMPARLDIGVRKPALAAVIDAAAPTEERWSGKLKFSASAFCQALDEAGPVGRVEDFPALAVLKWQRQLTVTLRHSLQLRISGFATVDIPLGTGDPPPQATTPPYRRTVRLIGDKAVNNVDEALDLVLLGGARDQAATVDLSIQVVSALGASETVDVADWRPVDAAADSATPIRLPLRDLMRQARLFVGEPRSRLRQARAELQFRYKAEGAATKRALVSLPIELELTAPQWLVCVDLGTSATAVWLGSALLASAPVRPLPLGTWLGATDRGHYEYVPGRRPEDQILIPSHIGLSSERQLRQSTDLLSLGDISLAGAAPAAVARRLAALGRRYDVSAPFVPASELPRYAGQIVFDPKRRLMMPGKSIPLAASVYAVPADGDGVEATNDIDLAALIGDYFDELGRYIVPRGLYEAAGLARARADSGNDLLEQWLTGLDDIGAVLTYPGGIEDERKQIYQEAGRRLISGLSGAAASEAWVKLIPEAVAAARYGIAEVIRLQDLADGDDYAFGAIDIGAGTYDVTLVSVRVRGRAIADWKLLSHFGILLGGHDLDRAIAVAVQQIIADAAEQDGIRGQFKFHAALPSTPTELHKTADPAERSRGGTFLRELQRAKRALTEALMQDGPYRWTGSGEAGSDGAEPPKRFDIEIWRPDERGWPIVPTAETLNGSVARWAIAGHDAELRLERHPTASLVLSLGPGVFGAPPAQPDRNDPRSIVELMGKELPAMTAAEADQLGLKATRWIVTGRAALWPPLYEAIGRAVAGGLALDRPFEADVMKKAVLLGATDLAREPNLDLGTDVLNPLAILSDRSRMPAVDGGPGGRRGALRYIHASRQPVGFIDDVPVHGRFQIVRALPGLDDPKTCDRRLALLEAMGVQPWIDVCNQDFFRVAESDTDVTSRFRLDWRRVGSNIWLTITDPTASEPWEIGPIPHNGRLYGAW